MAALGGWDAVCGNAARPLRLQLRPVTQVTCKAQYTQLRLPVPRKGRQLMTAQALHPFFQAFSLGSQCLQVLVPLQLVSRCTF